MWANIDFLAINAAQSALTEVIQSVSAFYHSKDNVVVGGEGRTI